MFKRLMLALAVGGSPPVLAPAANAAFGIAKWESITCKENVDTPLIGEKLVGTPFPAQSGAQCKGAKTTPGKLFTQAAGHPNFGMHRLHHGTPLSPENSGAGGFPEGFLHKIVVDTPEGLSVNPEAVPQCPALGKIKTTSVQTCKPGKRSSASTISRSLGRVRPCAGFSHGNLRPGPRRGPGVQRRTVQRGPNGRLPDRRRGPDLHRRLTGAPSISTSPSRSARSRSARR